MTNSVERVSINTTPSTQAREIITEIDDPNRATGLIIEPRRKFVPMDVIQRYRELVSALKHLEIMDGMPEQDKEMQIAFIKLEMAFIKKQYPNIEAVSEKCNLLQYKEANAPKFDSEG